MSWKTATTGTSTRRRRVVPAPCVLAAALWVVSFAPGLARSEELAPQRQAEILGAALDAYDDAVTIARSEPERALALYEQAAAGFQALADAGLRNAALEYNLGNVYFRIGDLGLAILHYRRAVQLDPTSERVAANLAYARRRVEPQIEPSGQRRLTHQLLFWYYRTSLQQRTWALFGCAAVGWALLLAWLVWRRRPVAVAGLVCVALATATGVSVRWQLFDEARHPHAVVVHGRPHLRLGRGEGADLALKQPLNPGVEVRILQRRGAWVEVQLRNEQTGWVPRTALEEI